MRVDGMAMVGEQVTPLMILHDMMYATRTQDSWLNHNSIHVSMEITVYIGVQTSRFLL